MSILILALVTLQRLAELVLARRNTQRLLAKGAQETGAAHYPLIVALHAAWLAGLWWFGWNGVVVWPWLILFVVAQAGRLWVLATLGQRWTTRILSLPGEKLVTTGPYRFIRHPNYAVVAAEMPLLPLALGLPCYALLFGVLNLAILAWRIHVEETAIRALRNAP